MSDPFVPVYDRDLVLVKGKGAKLVDRDGHASGIAGAGDRASPSSSTALASARNCPAGRVPAAGRPEPSARGSAMRSSSAISASLSAESPNASNSTAS